MKPRLLDLGATRTVFGTGVGLALTALLVPLLGFWHGADGPLGPSIPLFFLVPVLLASALGGQRAGVVVSVVAIFVWDWYFIPPFYTVTVYYARDLLALVVFLVVALFVGQLSKTVRRRAEEAIRRARSSEALYSLSMALIAHDDLDGVLPDLTRRLWATFDLEACAVVLPVDGGATWRTAAVAGTLPPALRADGSRDVASVVAWVHEYGRASGLGRSVGGRSQRRHISGWRAGGERVRFLPLRVGTHGVGVLELVLRAGVEPDPERERLLMTFANGAAIALEQARLGREEQEAAVARESDRLKTALLSSVSHDLRTPLAGIKAAASSLLQQDVQWSEEDRRAFAADIDAEVDRLTRLVSNLLDLSRIEAGALKPDKDWEDVGELITRVVHRLEPRLGGDRLLVDLQKALPPVRLDTVQIEQVLTNLIENGAKYSAPGAPITITARALTRPDGGRDLAIAVTDQGIGIPPAEQGLVFDKFYRVAGSSARVSGTGMGLAIVKGLVEAHGGHISVASAPGQGSTFTVTLPLEAESQEVPARKPAPPRRERTPR